MLIALSNKNPLAFSVVKCKIIAVRKHKYLNNLTASRQRHISGCYSCSFIKNFLIYACFSTFLYLCFFNVPGVGWPSGLGRVRKGCGRDRHVHLEEADHRGGGDALGGRAPLAAQDQAFKVHPGRGDRIKHRIHQARYNKNMHTLFFSSDHGDFENWKFPLHFTLLYFLPGLKHLSFSDN